MRTPGQLAQKQKVLHARKTNSVGDFLTIRTSRTAAACLLRNLMSLEDLKGGGLKRRQAVRISRKAETEGIAQTKSEVMDADFDEGPYRKSGAARIVSASAESQKGRPKHQRELALDPGLPVKSERKHKHEKHALYPKRPPRVQQHPQLAREMAFPLVDKLQEMADFGIDMIQSFKSGERDVGDIIKEIGEEIFEEIAPLLGNLREMTHQGRKKMQRYQDDPDVVAEISKEVNKHAAPLLGALGEVAQGAMEKVRNVPHEKGDYEAKEMAASLFSKLSGISSEAVENIESFPGLEGISRAAPIVEEILGMDDDTQTEGKRMRASGPLLRALHTLAHEAIEKIRLFGSESSSPSSSDTEQGGHPAMEIGLGIRKAGKETSALYAKQYGAHEILEEKQSSPYKIASLKTKSAAEERGAPASWAAHYEKQYRSQEAPRKGLSPLYEKAYIRKGEHLKKEQPPAYSERQRSQAYGSPRKGVEPSSIKTSRLIAKSKLATGESDKSPASSQPRKKGRESLEKTTASKATEEGKKEKSTKSKKGQESAKKTKSSKKSSEDEEEEKSEESEEQSEEQSKEQSKEKSEEESEDEGSKKSDSESETDAESGDEDDDSLVFTLLKFAGCGCVCLLIFILLLAGGIFFCFRMLGSTEETAATAPPAELVKSLYCNPSIMNELVTQHIQEWKELASKSGRPGELPALDTSTMRVLANYACKLPKKKALFVWAPLGSGKRHALDHMERAWERQGRLVVHIDLATFEGESSELLKIVQEETRGCKLSCPTIQALNGALTQRNQPTREKVHQSFISRIAKKIIAIMTAIAPDAVQSKEAESDIQVASMDAYLNSVVEEVGVSAFDLRTSLSVLDILSRYQPETAPVLLIHQLDAVTFLGGSKEEFIVNNLTQIVKEFEQKENTVSIILTTSDPIWFHKKKIAQLKHFKTYELPAWKEEAIKKILIKDIDVWSEKDFDMAWYSLGGHWRSIADVYESGLSVEEAIASVNTLAYMRLSSLISKSPKNAEALEDTLKRLSANNYYLTLKQVGDITPEMESFVHAAVLYIDSGLTLRPVSKSMHNAIENYLEALIFQKKYGRPEPREEQSRSEPPREEQSRSDEETT